MEGLAFSGTQRVLEDLLEPLSKQCEVEKNQGVTLAGRFFADGCGINLPGWVPVRKRAVWWKPAPGPCLFIRAWSKVQFELGSRMAGVEAQGFLIRLNRQRHASQSLISPSQGIVGLRIFRVPLDRLVQDVHRFVKPFFLRQSPGQAEIDAIPFVRNFQSGLK